MLKSDGFQKTDQPASVPQPIGPAAPKLETFSELAVVPPANTATRNSWSNMSKRMGDVAGIVTEEIASGRWPPESLSGVYLTELYAKFQALGNQSESKSSFRYGLTIFSGATSEDEVLGRVERHKSFGDWFSALSIAEKNAIALKRKLARASRWRALGESERVEARKEVWGAASADGLKGIPETQRGKIHKAFELSSAADLVLKGLEAGIRPGEAKRYAGVPEPMRSSWEALYARALSRDPNRFYMYEALGFPLYDPVARGVTAYHPDFIVFKRLPGGGLLPSIVEIKGRVLETGRRKIELFRKHYIERDFSDLSPAEQEVARALVETGTQMCFEQCRFRITPHTPFRVYGAKKWVYVDADGKRDRGFEESGVEGFIARLAKKFPELLPESSHAFISNREVKRMASQASNGTEDGSFLKGVSRGPRIQRSQEVIMPQHAVSMFYAHALVFFTAANQHEYRGASAHYWSMWSMHLASRLLYWHSYTSKEKESAATSFKAPDRHNLEALRLTPQEQPFAGYMSMRFLLYARASLTAAVAQYGEMGYLPERDFTAQLLRNSEDFLARLSRAPTPLIPPGAPDLASYLERVNAAIGRIQSRQAGHSSVNEFWPTFGVDFDAGVQWIGRALQSGSSIDFMQLLDDTNPGTRIPVVL